MKSPAELSFDIDITYDVGDYTIHAHRLTVGGVEMKTKHRDYDKGASGLSEQAKLACKNFELSQKQTIMGRKYYYD